ncbi:SURF1 family protein [Arhodomonas aquaeolei]|uniref:SURF1 family protein n=1 Tax=Arhodomonas aquaeolei TaxID=2369 RepID=UPI000590E947|nr:SURF1 family protein [Arhodomonas aquaeolei]
MHVGPFVFRPGRWPTLVTITLLPLLIALGFWQIDRAHQKEALIADRESAAAAPALQLNAGLPRPEAGLHRLARATGRYDSEHQFLLDNQTRDGVPGYRIITPLRLEGSDAAVLVDRGWVAAPPRRSQLPDVTVDATTRTVHGRLGDGPSVGLRLGDAYHGDGSWPRRIQYLDFDALVPSLPYTVPPYLLRTGAAAKKARPETMRFGPRRHYGYAVQWFALATALLVIYIGVNTRLKGRHERD